MISGFTEPISRRRVSRLHDAGNDMSLDEEVYTQGQDAFDRGEAICPYPPGRLRLMWMAGWDEAYRFALAAPT
jgi:ribosome modulation factor